MRAFWASGYEGTSIPMLAEAMGISAQSIYAAFGSKEALYREAIGFYVRTIGGYAKRALDEEGNAIEAIARLLRESAQVFARTTGTPGCMITAVVSDATNPLGPLGRELRTASVEAVEGRLRKGAAKRQVISNIDAHGWARYIGSVVQGMSIQARDGASAAELSTIAEIAIRTVETLRPGGVG